MPQPTSVTRRLPHPGVMSSKSLKAFASRLRNSSSPTRPWNDGPSQIVVPPPAEPDEDEYFLKQVHSNIESLRPSRLAALTSPCFFHRRFGEAVNLEKVLDEITTDESMSHSRFMQTATGVREVSKQLQRRPIRRAVRTVMIVTKARDNMLVTYTRDLAEWLITKSRYGSSNGVTVYVDAKLRNSKRFDAQGLLAQDPKFATMLQYWTPDLCWNSPERFDLVLTLGGDGTVLFTSWLFQRIVPPVLSFSLGSLGFLTPYDYKGYREHLDQVMGGLAEPASSETIFSQRSPANSDIVADAGMCVNLRMRFTCSVFRSSNGTTGLTSDAQEIAQHEVLNELVIDRGPSPYVSNLELYGDDSLITIIQADGVIFSTPTGSTAYSLSAGGSLVHPDIPAILLTPICPHTLSFRPMLLNDTMVLRIAIPRNSRATAYCSFDGKSRIELRRGDFVTISASRYPFPTVSRSGTGLEWVDSVSRTLRWNTREAQQRGWNGRPSILYTAGRPFSSGRMGSFAISEESAVDLQEEDGDEMGDRDEEDGNDEDYDIDFDNEEDTDTGLTSRDSGYEAESASSPSVNGAHFNKAKLSSH